MFGYVKASPALLSEDAKKRYNAFYCGLCHALGERHGGLSRLTLTYDMTFLVILLSSLYEPEEVSGDKKCPAHAIKPKSFIRNEITDYAADMNVALSYLNRLDDWNDDGNIISLAEAGLMKSSFEKVRERYPRQVKAIEEQLSKLKELEDKWQLEPDAAAGSFGELMAELFVYKEDRWSDTLRNFGRALGQFIYVMDACIDLRDDKRFYKYNPFVSYFNRTDEKEQFEDVLKMLMGECVFRFDKLPLVQDTELLRNILCSGVWNEFNRHYGIKADQRSSTDGSGPL